MSSTYSPVTADSALDLKERADSALFPSVKSTPTAEPCSASTGLTFPSMKMSENSLGKMSEQSTLFAEDTLASLSALPGSEMARQMTVTSGRSLLGLCGNSDRFGYLQRMLLGTSAWDSTKCFLTWKVSATPAGRLLFQLVPSEPATNELGSGLLPTLTARDFKSDSCSPEFRKKRDAMKIGKTLPWTLRGLLNPTWCEWFMGFPEGWTELEHSEMRLSRRSLNSSVKSYCDAARHDD